MESYPGQDPFKGDGYMIKGWYMEVSAGGKRSSIVQLYQKALAEYRLPKQCIADNFNRLHCFAI